MGRMFSHKLHHFSRFTLQSSLMRYFCSQRSWNCVGGLLFGSGKQPRGRLHVKPELQQSRCLLNSPLSSARIAGCKFLKTDLTFPVTCAQTRRYSQRLGSLHELTTSSVLKMSEAQRQLFREKHQKRQNRLARGLEGKLDRNGRVSIQVTGTGTRASPPSILVIAESVRFLFNCGEGTQRLMFENRVKNLAKLEHIFFTRMTWDNLGGTIGMMITLKNVGLPKMFLYGPPELTEFSKALQIFAKHETIDLDVKPHTQGPFFNEVMTVTPVPLHAGDSNQGESSHLIAHQPSIPKTPPMEAQEADQDEIEEKTEAEEEISNEKKRKAKDPFDVISQMAVKQRASTGPKRRRIEEASDTTIAYICKLHDTHGRLDVQKAKDLGLKPGPEYGQLKAGKAVMTPDGKEIKPEDVLEPTSPGAVFIVLECPDEKFVDTIVNNQVISRYQADGENTAGLVFHICPEKVINDTRYHSWMQRFGPTTEHIIFNETCHSVTHEGSRRIQAKLNLINKDIFPLLPVHKDTDEDQQNKTNKKDSSLMANIHKAESYVRYHLRPHTGWDREFVQSPSNEPFVQEAMAVPGFGDRLCELGNQLTEHRRRCSTETRPRYPEVVFFGTGSAMPNKERNVTGILLNLSSSHSMIMDCGEGTFNQMCRFYGDRMDDVLANLQSVFVSHMHADHHVGLIQILCQWKRVMLERGETSKNMILVGPKRMLIWLNNYNSSCEPFIHQMRFIELRDLSRKCDDRPRHEQSLLARLNLTEYETVPVPHCFNSHGLVIKHKDGWKLVYSGDAMPSDELVQAGKNADILIHEATLEDGLEAEAQKKRHSMISQAIEVGQRMDARFILLTHFSQRYPKIPIFDEQLSRRVGVAFDNMRVSLSQLDQLPLCLPALKHLFTEYIQEMHDLRDRKAEKKTIVPLDSALRSGKVIGEETDPVGNGDKAKTEGQASSVS